MRIFERASFALLLSMASTPLAGCSAESPEGEAAEEAYEEDQLDSAQAALCVMSQIPPYATDSLSDNETVDFFSGSVDYTDNCADHYVVEVTNAGRHPYEGFDISTSWDNTINNESLCSAAHVRQLIYGYAPSQGAWVTIAGWLTATGEWGTHGASRAWCKVDVSYRTSADPESPIVLGLPYVDFSEYSKIRVVSQAWQYHAWGPSIHPVSVQVYKGPI